MTYYFDLGVDGLFTDFPDTGVEAREMTTPHADVTVRNQHGQCGRHSKNQYNHD